MKNLLLLFFVFLSVQATHAQKRRLSLPELMAEIQQSKDTVYRLSDAEIYIEEERNGGFGFNQSPMQGGNISAKNADTVTINKHLILDKISFLNRGIFFSYLIFKKNVVFTAFEGEQIGFSNCVFEGNSYFDKYRRIDLTKCVFKKSCAFNGEVRTMISNCVFGIKDNQQVKTRQNVSFTSAAPDHAVIISNSEFHLSGQNSEVSFFLKFSEINIRYCHFTSFVFFRYVFLSDKFFIKNNEFEKKVVFATIKVPIENSAITWSNLKNKIAVLRDTTLQNRGRLLEEGIYTAKNEAELADENNYDEFISVYSKFLQIFKFRSNSSWYNQCYVEMKDVMTRKSAYQYQQMPSMRNYLDWKIKSFLKDFSDYGTDYTKSILYAIDVIFWFAFIYFFFPSDRDNLSKKRFFAFFRKSAEYFKTDISLVEMYKTQREVEIKNLQNFRAMLISSQGSIPSSILFITKPFYKINLMINTFSLWILKHIDLVRGKWEDLSLPHKFWLNIYVTLFFIGYVLWGVFMRALNAFALSLNSLTTLGYGGISARGISRYLVVVEGLIGWFLLTIFGVSLIGQVL